VAIHSLATTGLGDQTITSVSLLGSHTKLQFEQKPDGLRITLPAKPAGSYAYVFRITLGQK
jgi:alpha-L-fucosidase